MRSEEKSCTGKVRFLTRKRAKLALRRLKGSGRKDEGHVMPYACDYCDYWHLGHLPSEVFRGVIDKDTWRNS